MSFIFYETAEKDRLEEKEFFPLTHSRLQLVEHVKNAQLIHSWVDICWLLILEKWREKENNNRWAKGFQGFRPKGGRDALVFVSRQ